MTNNADNLDFGLVGCRRSVPHLQRLLMHLEDSLADLERAVGSASFQYLPNASTTLCPPKANVLLTA